MTEAVQWVTHMSTTPRQGPGSLSHHADVWLVDTGGGVVRLGIGSWTAVGDALPSRDDLLWVEVTRVDVAQIAAWLAQAAVTP